MKNMTFYGDSSLLTVNGILRGSLQPQIQWSVPVYTHQLSIF